ncbi:hypothetical protein ALP97_200276 [Pseudomonas salomonii]|uniref:Uncharacterized protein n=1 Tax=Pseudomonas salomonii TaxID=191391 RepID=A0A3M4QGG7_9PSED|nr:hypothetical protein ALP97_200276 [Pseudomonas salomonii]
MPLLAKYWAKSRAKILHHCLRFLSVSLPLDVVFLYPYIKQLTTGIQPPRLYRSDHDY